MLVHLVVLAIVFVVSFVAFFMLSKSEGQLKSVKVILMFLLFTVLMSAGGLVSKSSSDSMSAFFMIQVFCLVLGYVSSFLLKKEFFGQLGNEKGSKVSFVLANAAAGMIGFTLLFDHFNGMGLAPYYSLSAFSFVLPQFFATSFESYTEIPQEIFKVWYYPIDKEIDFDKIDTSKIFMLEMEFSKSIADNKLVNSKAKAPLGMVFGDWFMSFIENYNHKFDTDPIQYVNEEDNTLQGWIFYVKPSFFGSAKYIDPDLSIEENKINEKNVIIAKRVAVV